MTTLTIAKREFRGYFDSPIAYVVICLGLLGLGLFFFNYGGGFWQADRATLQSMFVMLPWALAIVVIPVITMSLIAQERSSGTLEMLITLPVKDHEVVIGKFLGAWGLVLVLVMSTALYPLFMFSTPWNLGPLDSGPVLSGYVGMIFFSAAATAIGLLVSSLTDSQIIAFFITFMVLGSLMLLGTSVVIRALPPKAEWVINFASFTQRVAPFVRGMINSRDIIYFTTITIGCLMGSFWALERRKWA